MPQLQLPFFPHGSTEINRNLAFLREGDHITYWYGHLPVFGHDVGDLRTFRMITSQFYVNGNATQAELCRAFGVSAISVKRAVKLYRKKGPSGFYEERRTRGAAVLTEAVIGKAQGLLDDGHTSAEVAIQLALKKDTVRKAVQSGRLHEVKKSALRLAARRRLPGANEAS